MQKTKKPKQDNNNKKKTKPKQFMHLRQEVAHSLRLLYWQQRKKYKSKSTLTIKYTDEKVTYVITGKESWNSGASVVTPRLSLTPAKVLPDKRWDSAGTFEWTASRRAMWLWSNLTKTGGKTLASFSTVQSWLSEKCLLSQVPHHQVNSVLLCQTLFLF